MPYVRCYCTQSDIVMCEVYIGIGSNVGDRYANITRACQLMSRAFKIEKLSSIYETEPEGYKNQADFLNAVIKARVDLGPAKILELLKRIEGQMGRLNSFRNAPRIIDLDILMIKDKVVREPGLNIPHPLLHQRSFVLIPLVEIEPELMHPALHKTIRELLSRLKPGSSVRKWGTINYDLNVREHVSDICREKL